MRAFGIARYIKLPEKYPRIYSSTGLCTHKNHHGRGYRVAVKEKRFAPLFRERAEWLTRESILIESPLFLSVSLPSKTPSETWKLQRRIRGAYAWETFDRYRWQMNIATDLPFFESKFDFCFDPASPVKLEVPMESHYCSILTLQMIADDRFFHIKSLRKIVQNFYRSFTSIFYLHFIF